MKSFRSFLKKSILNENSAFVLLLGLCPLLACSTSCVAGCFLGISALFVLVLTGVVVSLVGRFIPERVKTVSYMVLAAGFVTVVELLLNAFLPSVYEAIGIYLPLVVVSGMCFERIECAEGETVKNAALGGLSMGLGYLAASFVLSFIRELFGRGTLFGFRIFPEEYSIRVLTSPAGALILFGFLLAVFRYALLRVEKKEVEK